MVKDIVHHEHPCFRLNPIKASRDTTVNLFTITIIFLAWVVSFIKVCQEKGLNVCTDYSFPDKDFGLRYRSPNNINWARRRTNMYDLLGFLPLALPKSLSETLYYERGKI